MDIRRQQQKIHNLRHPGAADMPAASDFGKVADLAGIYEFLDVMGEGKQAGDSGHGSLWLRQSFTLWRSLTFDQLRPTLMLKNVHLVPDLQFAVVQCAPFCLLPIRSR